MNIETNKEKCPSIIIFGETEGLIKILKEVFIKEGYDTFMTTERNTVLELLETQKPDVLLIDVVVFSNNILQTIDLVRKQSDVPIVILSIQNNTPVSANILKKDVDGFVAKPFRMNELLEQVKVTISQNRLD